MYFRRGRVQLRCTAGLYSGQTHLGVVVVHEVEVDPQLPHALERITELEAERRNTKYLHYNTNHIVPSLQR